MLSSVMQRGESRGHVSFLLRWFAYARQPRQDTFGPKGMNKLSQSVSYGDINVTSDGATILKKTTPRPQASTGTDAGGRSQ